MTDLQKNPQGMKLGKKSARIDSRTLRLSKYIKELPSPPDEMGYITAVRDFPVMLNDAIGDCTIACAGHQIQQWTTYAQPPGVTPSDADILRAYEAVSGYIPNNPGSDGGAVVLSVLNYWRKIGIAGHKIFAYASIDVRNVVELEQAVTLFGSVYLGVGLPISARSPRIDESGLPIWEVPANGPFGVGQPWSWGGHAIPLMGYKSNHLANGGGRVVSWGRLYDVTWNFLAAYCDEAYAILSADWIDKSGRAPSGFDLAALEADLAAI